MIFAAVSEASAVTWPAVMGVFGLLELCFTVIEKARSALGVKAKRDVWFAQEFATEEEFEQEKRYAQERRKSMYEKFDEAKDETATLFRELQKEMKEDIGGVHGRIDLVGNAVSELRGEIKQALKETGRRVSI